MYFEKNYDIFVEIQVMKNENVGKKISVKENLDLFAKPHDSANVLKLFCQVKMNRLC